MGNGAGVLGDEDRSVLTSVVDVDNSAYEDKVNFTLKKKEAFLEQQRRMVVVSGVVSDAPYAQPMAVEKMERSLTCLDNLYSDYRDDMRKDSGYVELPTDSLFHGSINSICALNDDATVACAMGKGPISVYNWRDGSLVSQFRKQTEQYNYSAVTKLCVASDDYSLLASGDDQGYVALWDLTEPMLKCDVRLHEEAITGLQWDVDTNHLISTSSDTYILMYDPETECVVERAAPTGSGKGVPNTMLTQCSAYKKLLLVGGKDGKLRIWSTDDKMKEECVLSLGSSVPTRCCVASDGWRTVVGTVPMADDSPYYNKNAIRSGRNAGTTGDLLVFDLRMMREDMAQTTAMASFAGGAAGLKKGGSSIFGTKSVASRWTRNSLKNRSSQPSLGEKAEEEKPVVSTGVTDMTLIEENNKCLAFCLIDGIVKGFDLDESGTLQPSFSFNPGPFDTPGAKPQAIACKDRYMFTSSSSPALSVWERTSSGDQYGHEDYQRPGVRPPLELTAQYVRPKKPAKNYALSKTVSSIEESLRRDRARTHVQELPRGAGKYAITFKP